MWWGILIGIGSCFALGLLIRLTDREGRELIVAALITIPALLVAPLYLLIRKLVDGDFRVRLIEPEVLRRYANSHDIRGVAIHRRGRAYLVFTDSQVWKMRHPEMEGKAVK